MNNYELVFIARGDLDGETLTDFVQNYAGLIENLGGQVDQVETWGKRRLAYPIRKQNEGYYYVTQIQLDPSAIQEVERVLKLADAVLRYLVIRRA